MNWRLCLFVFFGCLMAYPVHAQIGGDFGSETVLYAETKQVNQFFRRFNCEEGRNGERFYPGNPLYRDPEFRLGYLDILFDNEGGRIPEGQKRDFIRHVSGPDEPSFLSFHGPDWLAEVKTRFFYEGEERDLTLFMRLEADRLGHKWVIDRVHFAPYEARFSKRKAAEGEFLHPLSHELDFMNLNKVFRSSTDLQGYLPGAYSPDQLTLFLLDVAEGKLRFKTVNELRFHFFQIEGWYFELKDFQRPGYNTGWLISRLQALEPGEDKLLLRNIYHGSK